ncbi:BUD13 homolog [Cephus cinctus]|uniref:BUD13 homolog n=1 Tax=Cephus cinctus TaxID=211228 RepID=A0AAJ7CF90_CEPCN|nr:BUD13 homolog [Cephus cinctus]XP_024947692.1 BUD13 homolog [Cephus cinctus]
MNGNKVRAYAMVGHDLEVATNMASGKIDQKEYLKKYLSFDDEMKKKKKNKKKKHAKVGVKTVKIIDDDVNLKHLRPIEDGEFDILNHTEDAPQIVGIIDERGPVDFSDKRRWKIIADDGDGDITVTSSENNIRDADDSIPDSNRKNDKLLGTKKSVSSAPFTKSKKTYDSDCSPPRRKENKNNSDLDLSPPRNRQNNNNVEHSPARKSRKHSKRSKDYESDLSPPRKKKNSKQSDSDISPPRKWQSNNSSDRGSGRKSKDYSKFSKNYDSDLSPPRKRQNHLDSDSDLSPPRNRRNNNNTDHSSIRRERQKSHSRHDKDYHSDLSPPRRSKHDSRNTESTDSKYNNDGHRRRMDKHRNKHNMDSDINSPGKSHRRSKTPPRKSTSRWDHEPRRRSRTPDNPKDQDRRMKKTLDGKTAGLQNARALREETDAHKKREAELFSKLSADVSGVGQAAVLRDRKTGRKRDLAAEAAEKREKQKVQEELDEKYAKWGKGLKQVEDREEKLKRDLYEMSKPLARYADDADLDKELREQDREGDPMLEYIKQKQIKEGKRKPEKPRYEGTFMPNRFGIKPGHRWDGVDRSNGYEKKWFDAQNARKALQEEAYKWSTSDM